MVKKYLYIGLSTFMTLATMSCADDAFMPDPDDPFAQPGDRAETFEVPLNIITDRPQNIGTPHVNDIPSRADGDDNVDYERPTQAMEDALKDIWVFQYDEDGNQLIAPRYYEVSSTEIRKLNIRLAEGVDSHVYVLANTCDSVWAVGKDLTTVEKFVGYEYPFEEKNVEMGKDKYLLMEGDVKQTINKETDIEPVDIHLTRMMAKISFKYVTAEAAKGLMINQVIINNMPVKMRMEETPIENNYPEGDDFETRMVTIDKKLASGQTYTFYMPANRRGTNDNTDPKLKNNHAPKKALYVQMLVTSQTNGSNYLYTIYLGANDYNDFNVRRNHNYNITLNLLTENRDDRVLAAPANCYVMNTQNEIMFDPYTRTETGGGWKYTDYVNANDPKKQINSVKILWQTGNAEGNKFAIGDNSNGDRVYIDEVNRIHVKAGETNGNAVIAGYNGKNGTGDIVWSWHIWVNDNEPAKLSNAVKYTTYKWDSNNIYTGTRVPGYSFMSCNIGALSAKAGDIYAFGMYYQWGRKDPFPQTAITGTAPEFYGNKDPYVTPVYGNDAKRLTMSSTAGAEGETFRTIKVTQQTGNIDYAIKHPTVFMGAVTPGLFENGHESSGQPTTEGNGSSHDPAYYTNDGDWLWGHDDTLWGGVPFDDATVNYQNIVANNGAEKKSIFDPCPSGWMLPASDAWMGFTSTGMNTDTYSQQNYSNHGSERAHLGMTFWMQGWRSGTATSFFPLCGWRTADGSCFVVKSCGGYYTSAASYHNASSIFHIHPDLVHPYDYGYQYARRACAYPVRCVRDELD